MGTPAFDQLDPAVRFSAELAQSMSAVDVIAAQDACHELNQTLTTLLADVSFLICPVVAGRVPEPWRNGTVDGVPDPNWVRFTYPFNLTRSPCGTVPIGLTDDGVPVGLQVVGSNHADAAVLRMLAYLETIVGMDAVAPVG